MGRQVTGSVRSLYARVGAIAAAAPLILLLPVAMELIQHGVEIRLGMYAQGGHLDGHAQAIRLAFGAGKILAILLTIFVVLRFWRLGSFARALRPGLGFLRGLLIVAVVQIAAEALALLIGRLLARLVPSGPVHLLLLVAPLLGWLIGSCLLLPWYVGLITDDNAMTLRRSIAGVRGRLWSSFGLLVAGVAPLMILHYALGYAAFRAPASIVWLLMIADAGIVAFLALAIASAYFTIYGCAATASGHTQAINGVPSAITSTDKGSPSRQ